ncbi:unnamed protein product [Parajaminaea phylloscopi]
MGWWCSTWATAVSDVGLGQCAQASRADSRARQRAAQRKPPATFARPSTSSIPTDSTMATGVMSSLPRGARRVAGPTLGSLCAAPLPVSASASASGSTSRSSRRFSSAIQRQQLHATQLASRGVIAFEGANPYKLLQGLTTNDVRRLEEQVEARNSRRQHGDAAAGLAPEKAFYCGFLNPQGRLIAPAFLYDKPEPQPVETASSTKTKTVFLDCPLDSVTPLSSSIKRFMLRSGVKMRDSSDQWHVWVVWSDDGSLADKQAVQAASCRASSSASSSQAGPVWIDERAPEMGWRTLHSAGEVPAFIQELRSAHSLVDASDQDYIRHRMRQGVPDGTDELQMGQTMPLEANLDFMGGVDYKKGCYIGQELTSRTHHLGVVRKRIMPVRLVPPEGESNEPPLLGQVRAPPPPASSSSNSSKRSKPAGNVLAVSQDSARSDGSYVGLAMLRLQHVLNALEAGDSDASQRLELPQAEGKASWTVLPTWPDWWPAEAKDKVLAADANSSE